MTASLLPTREWLDERRSGLGASDAPVIMRCSPWRTERELAAEKLGEGKDQPETHVMALGHYLEPIAAELYANETGRKVRRVRRTVRHPRYPELFAHPDYAGDRRLVEIKTSRIGWHALPEYVFWQVQHQLGCIGYDEADVAHLSFDGLHIFPVARDDMAIANLFAAERAWWRRYVLEREPFPEPVGDEPMVADEAQEKALTALQAVRQRTRQLKAEDDTLVEWLKGSMVGSTALVARQARVSWKPTKARETTDWQLVASELGKAHPELFETLRGLHTLTSAGSQPFRVTFTEDIEA